MKTKSKMGRGRLLYLIAQVLWIGLCFAVLANYLYFRAIHPQVTDADEVTGYAMLALAFPIGFIDLVVSGWVDLFFPVPSSTIWMWAELFLLGYIQWFVLLPLLVRKIRQRQKRTQIIGRSDRLEGHSEGK